MVFLSKLTICRI